MFKVFWLLKRKPGISHEQFRAHYEASHSQLAHAYIGHLMTGYHRNYVESVYGSTEHADGSVTFGPMEPEWDCIAEWMMTDEAAFDEINRIMAEPTVRAVFHEDEKRFADRSAFKLVRVEVVDTGTGDGHLTMAADQAAVQ